MARDDLGKRKTTSSLLTDFLTSDAEVVRESKCNLYIDVKLIILVKVRFKVEI